MCLSKRKGEHRRNFGAALATTGFDEGQNGNNGKRAVFSKHNGSGYTVGLGGVQLSRPMPGCRRSEHPWSPWSPSLDPSMSMEAEHPTFGSSGRHGNPCRREDKATAPLSRAPLCSQKTQRRRDGTWKRASKDRARSLLSLGAWGVGDSCYVIYGTPALLPSPTVEWFPDLSLSKNNTSSSFSQTSTTSHSFLAVYCITLSPCFLQLQRRVFPKSTTSHANYQPIELQLYHTLGVSVLLGFEHPSSTFWHILIVQCHLI